MRTWLSRGRRWLLYTTVGGVAVLEGCDTSVRSDVLTGVGSAATSLITTFIDAFFTSMINQQEDDNSLVRVFTDPNPQIFA